MATILRCSDRWGRPVALDERCWRDHVLRRRPYFAGHERACVADVLANPAFVRQDVDYPDRECFYAASPLPPPHHGLLVKVVVAYPLSGGEGAVVTVHLTSGAKPGEGRTWP